MNEYIYILSNPSMGGMIKVGKTTHHPNKRMSELRSTGVPTPFVLELSLSVRDCHASERAAHIALDKYRVTGDREFFKISVKSAVQVILPVIGDYDIDDANSSFDIKEVERWFHRKRIKEERAHNDKLWADYLERLDERGRVTSEISALKNNLAKLGRRPERDSLPDPLSWFWFVTAPMPFGWMFWPGILGIFSERTMPLGLICSVFATIGFLLDKKVSQYRDDFNSKNVEFARIDSLIGDLEKKLERLPELQKPSERQPDNAKRVEPWVTSREVAVNSAKAKEMIREKHKSDYKFSATEDFMKYRANSVESTNRTAAIKTLAPRTDKYSGCCSHCGTHFEVTLNIDERTALCPKCFHPNQRKLLG